MAWQSGGGGGYPGVTGDALGNLTVARSVQVGDPATQNVPTFDQVYGNVSVADTQYDSDNGNATLDARQSATVTVTGYGPAAQLLRRQGDITAHDYSDPMVLHQDISGSAQPIYQASKDGVVVLELKVRQSITGALSTVADAPAKAVLTAIIAALTGIKVANNNTT